MAKILIVDDAAFMRMMLKDILTKGGFEIAGEAADGVEAVAKYNELKPDLVTLDITMPNKDGIQALKEIKAADPNATCVMCSAMGQQSMVIEAISGRPCIRVHQKSIRINLIILKKGHHIWMLLFYFLFLQSSILIF